VASQGARREDRRRRAERGALLVVDRAGVGAARARPEPPSGESQRDAVAGRDVGVGARGNHSAGDALAGDRAFEHEYVGILSTLDCHASRERDAQLVDAGAAAT
jgi:hypothetical protein